MGEHSNIVFREVQRFRQPWLWLLVALVAATGWYAVIQQLVLSVPFGNNPAPDAVVLVLWIVVGIAFPLLFHSMMLITEVRNDGVYVRFFPFHLSPIKIAFDELQKYEVQTYCPIKEYGGWGIRYGRKGKAYNVSGNRGVRLELLDGKPVLIGSQKPEELASAIDLAVSERNHNRPGGQHQ